MNTNVTILLSLLNYLFAGVVVGQQILVDDLELTTELGAYESPTDITFSSDGTLFACNKRGILTASDPGSYDQPRTVLDLREQICENGERGLLGVALHPDFGMMMPYVYLMYTYKKDGSCSEDPVTGPIMRMSRFTFTGTMFDPETEEIFLETPPFPYDHHNAGAIKFGKDGLIYATIGDGGENDYGQVRSNLFGTVVRLSPDNTIPPGNPYSPENTNDSVRCGRTGGVSGDASLRCQEIFAYGLRNPFRFSMNPNVDRVLFHVNDVGASLFEEVSVGGDGYEGANYGWPVREGPCKKGSECGDVCAVDDTYQEPEHFYRHDANDEGAITGGAFIPNGLWPARYDGMYVYGDYVYGKIYIMKPHDRADRSACPLISQYEDEAIIDYPESFISAMDFAPNGDLYFLMRGFGGRLSRIRFSGERNRDPQPHLEVSAKGGEAGTVIEFDGSGSTDPDGDKLTYEWDFNEDGVVDSTSEIASFQFNVGGVFQVMLTVRDGSGGRASATVEIGIGEYPVAEIVVPGDGVEFYVGENFDLRGAASGAGTADGEVVMTWEVKQHHGGHFHPYLERTDGNPVKLQAAPSPEDFLASEISYLEVILTVQNAFGLKATVTRSVMPQLRNVEVHSIPEGKTIMVDGYEIVTPTSFISWANHPLKLDAVGDNFKAWANGGAKAHTSLIPMESNITSMFVALYEEEVPTVAPFPPVPPVGFPAPVSLALNSSAPVEELWSAPDRDKKVVPQSSAISLQQSLVVLCLGIIAHRFS